MLFNPSVVAAFFSAVAAAAAVYIALQQYRITKHTYVFSLHEKYFDILDKQASETLNEQAKMKMSANFFEHVCWSFYQGRIASNDMELFETDMRNKTLTTYVKERRRENPNWYKYYAEWIKKSNK